MALDLESLRNAKPRRFGSHALVPKADVCAFCSMPAVNRCEMPKCQLPLCRRHLVRKFGGHLCWRHRGAILVQHESLPFPEASAESIPSRRFKDAGITEAKP